MLKYIHRIRLMPSLCWYYLKNYEVCGWSGSCPAMQDNWVEKDEDNK